MAKGGMRYGAGRPGWHGKAENHRSIDVRRFKRENMLRPGSWSWQWRDSATNEVVSSIGVTGSAHAITLNYTAGDHSITERIGVTFTACGFGGERAWFSCPRCHERAAKLYLRATRFACRNCHRLVYASQSEDLMGRAWRVQRKLEARLGPNMSRVKGMHRATREKIMQQIWACEEMRDHALAAFLGQMGVIEERLNNMLNNTKQGR